MNSMSRSIFLYILLLLSGLTAFSQVSREQKYARGVETIKLQGLKRLSKNGLLFIIRDTTPQTSTII